MTDRVYLASNDGQILCLHHRDDVQPLRVKTFEALEPKAKSVEKKADDKLPKSEDKALKDKDDKDKVRPGGALQTRGAFGNQEAGGLLLGLLTP